VAEALRFVEDRALFTREGTGGVRQVNVTGLVAAAFTHRDSRAGDPDLHTHVAVANKVQTLAGRWLSIDGRVLHSAKVAASETYNTSLEYHLTASLGVRFAERPGGTGRSGRSGRSSEWIRGLPAAGRPGVRSSTSAEAWRERAADRVVAALEEHRATWQYWHLWPRRNASYGVPRSTQPTHPRHSGRRGQGDHPLHPTHPPRRAGTPVVRRPPIMA
jgi:hypothetical protein